MPDSPGLFSMRTFIPTDITGCLVWLKADSLSLSDGTAVSTWTDSSGSGNDFSQSTGSLQPIYHTNIINSLPSVQFDGLTQFMSSPNNTSIPPLTLFIVTQPTLNTASQKNYACMFHSRSAGGNGLFLVAKLTASFWGTFTTADFSSGNALTSGSNYLLENTSANSSTFLYQRGTQLAFQAANEAGVGAVFGLGKDAVNANRQYAGYISEVIVYNSVLVVGNRQLVENYLIARYAL